MKTIPLRPLAKGMVALVSDEDFHRLNRYHWSAHADGRTHYAAGCIDGVGRMLMHRFIMCAPPDKLVDHWDGCGLNNTRENLRLATHSQNAANRPGKKLLKGIFWSATHQKWHAIVCCRGRRYHCGSFADPVDAAEAYDAKARHLFGEFAHLNGDRIKQLPRHPKLVPLLGGGGVLVDAADYSNLTPWPWLAAPSPRGLRVTGVVHGRRWLLTHYLLDLTEGSRVTFLNENPFDCQRHNLVIKRLIRKPSISAKTAQLIIGKTALRRLARNL